MSIKIEYARTITRVMYFNTDDEKEARRKLKLYFGSERIRVLKVEHIKCDKCGCLYSLVQDGFICARCNSR